MAAAPHAPIVRALVRHRAASWAPSGRASQCPIRAQATDAVSGVTRRYLRLVGVLDDEDLRAAVGVVLHFAHWIDLCSQGGLFTSRLRCRWPRTAEGEAFRHGLVDECVLLLCQVLVGGGKPALPRGLVTQPRAAGPETIRLRRDHVRHAVRNPA